MYDNKKIKQVKDSHIFVGVDIGQKVHNVSFLNKFGEVIKLDLKIACSRNGFENFEKELAQVACKESVVIGFEPTGHYWKNFGYYLKERGYKIFLISPYSVKLTKEMRDNSPRKTDKKDGLLIAHLLREGKFLNVRLLDGNYEDLRRLTVLRSKLSKEQSRTKVRLRTIIDEYLPEYSDCFSGIGVKTSLELLKVFSIEQLRDTLNKNEIVKIIRTTSRYAISQERSLEIASKIGNSIGTKQGINGAQEEIHIWVAQIEYYINELKKLDDKIVANLFEIDEAKYLLSIPGVGMVTAGTILGQTGSFSDFSNAKKLEKLAGLDLVESSSGKRQGLKRISKRGRDQLRHALFKVAIVAIAKNKEIKQFYSYKTDVVKKEKMVALTDITIKLLRIMFALTKNKTMYNGSFVLQGLPILEARGR